MNIRTERLLLRPLDLSDAPEIQRLAGDRDVASTTRDIPHPYEDGAAETWINSCRGKTAAGELVIFAITLQKDGSFLGAIGLDLDANRAEAELSYWVGKPFWNQGYATEAAKAVLRHGLVETGLDRVYAAHFSRNPASGRVMQKAGMLHEGFLKGHTEKWGKFEDLELYGVMRERFLGGSSG
ncbi:MAG: GNAT family N-acetyltransferase [Chloroflexi bacterium]|nr:GNAT family N-acetyltransferase [Chloroflexota bacterium]